MKYSDNLQVFDKENLVLDSDAVEKITTLSRTGIWRLRKKDKFPEPIKLSKGRIGWTAISIKEWIVTSPNLKISEDKENP